MLSKVLNPDKPGGIKSPGLEKIEKIARALSVSPGWLAFGEEPANQPLSEETLTEMVGEATDEIQPGLSIAQIKNAVGSRLREQLALHLSVGASSNTTIAESAHDIAAQSLAPTKGVGPEESRSS